MDQTPQGENLLVGDFNLHYPLWDREGRHSRGADGILALAEHWQLALATPWGEPTRIRKGNRDSTIDMMPRKTSHRATPETPISPPKKRAKHRHQPTNEMKKALRDWYNDDSFYGNGPRGAKTLQDAGQIPLF
jgi:hypothetical protein